MDMVEITVRVSKEYVEEAEEFGMLDPDAIAQILREELDKRIMKFVDAEVKAHRAEPSAKDTT